VLNGIVGVVVNPVAGRDIRRVAARGGVSSSQDKRNRVARAVVGAVTAGARRVIVMDEPFRVGSGAVADLRLDAEIEVLDVGARLDPGDTRRATEAMRSSGADVLIVVGGDGTNRTVAQQWPDATLVSLSTGTNNVFPSMAEATVAGAAAGLVATGRVARDEVAPRAKVVHVGLPDGGGDLALIDAVHLAGDFVGNRMPFDAERIRLLVLSRSEPAAMGVSAVGGLTHPCGAHVDAGVVVRCGPGGRPVHTPIAPGSYAAVPVLSAESLPFEQPVTVGGPGVLAFDGDRERWLEENEVATFTVRRDGPSVVDIEAVMRLAADRGLFVGRPPGEGDGAGPSER
jgi:hypothetical protein